MSDSVRISRRGLLHRCVACLGAIIVPRAWSEPLATPRSLYRVPTGLVAARGPSFLPSEQAVARNFGSAARYDRWEVIGPGGGGGNFLPTISPHDPRCVLVSCDMTGAYISRDGGESWRMFNLGGSLHFFLFDPVDSKVIYAKTTGGIPEMRSDRPTSSATLFRSADAGRTWRLLRTDSPTNQLGGSPTALAIDPEDSAILYAAFQKDQDFDLRISHDLGKTWAKVANLPDGGDKIFIDPRSPRQDRTLYVIGANSVAVREGRRWRSGQTLKDVESYAGRPELHGGIVSAGFPEKGGELVVYMIAGGTLHISEDGGGSWRESPLPGSSSPLTVVAVATSLWHPDVAYVSYNNRRRGADALYGVAKTTDRGHTWDLVWKESTMSAPNIHDSWMSERFGPSWGGNPTDLGVAPASPDICYGCDSGRTLRTTDGGRTWQGVYSTKLPDGTYTTTGLDVTTCYGVHFDPFNPKRIFIGYTDISLFRSENGGRSWISSTAGVPERWLNTTYWIVFDPEVRGRTWGVMSEMHDLPRPKMWAGGSVARFSGGVCRSDDGGRTWKASGEGMPQAATTHIVLDPASPARARVLYVAALGGGVYKSTDGGDRWTLKNSGLLGDEPFAWRLTRDANGVLYLVVARRSDDGSIGGEGDGALYRSSDGADHWTKIQLPEGCNGPEGLAVDQQDPQRLYLAAWGRLEQSHFTAGGVFLSTDAGGTWRHVLTQNEHIYDVTIDPRNPGILYACGFEASAWRSTDRGENWSRIRGFNFKWGHRVIPDPDDPAMIYITTYGGGVWYGPAEGDSNAVEDILPNSG